MDECWIATGEGTCYDGYLASEHPDIQHIRVTSIMEYDNGTSGPYVYTSYACSQCISNLKEWGDAVELLDQPVRPLTPKLIHQG
jgi:hypothetical protein